MKVSDFFADWLASKKPDLERSTYDAYVIYLTRHIVPYFDALGKELEQITPLDVKGYVTLKRSEGRADGKLGGLSKVSVRKHLNILKQAFNDAVILEILDRNPALPIKLPRTLEVSSSARFIGLENARKILDALQGHELYDLVFVTLMYGLRRSEVLGLRWDAVDFEKATLQIRHVVVKSSTIEAKDRAKTVDSMRVFPLLPDVANVLQERRNKAPPGSSYIFVWPDGRLYRPDYVTRSFQRCLKRHGLDAIRFHDLRHATATILFDRGWNLADVQHWLGHSDIETTKNIYIAYNRQRTIALGGSLNGIFKSRKW